MVLMRNALVGLALLGLLALAAAGSSGDEWGGGVEDRSIPPAFVDYAYTVGVVALVAWAALVLWALSQRSRGGLPQRPRGFSLVAFLAFTLALTGYFAITNARLDRPERDDSESEGAARLRDPPSAEGLEEAPAPEFQWWVAAAAALLAVALLANERRRRRRPPRDTAAEELETVLSETLEELELDPDPRRAVIQAYARMERVLGAHGHARRPAEAPLESLGRVLRERDVRATAAHALTELFERAKFSRHEIDAAMRAEAVASLEAVRDDLRAAA